MVWSCLGLIQVISTCCLCLFRCFMHRIHRFSSPPGSLGPWMHFLRWSKPKVERPHSIISLWISHFSFKKQEQLSCKLFHLLYFSRRAMNFKNGWTWTNFARWRWLNFHGHQAVAKLCRRPKAQWVSPASRRTSMWTWFWKKSNRLSKTAAMLPYNEKMILMIWYTWSK